MIEAERLPYLILDDFCNETNCSILMDIYILILNLELL